MPRAHEEQPRWMEATMAFVAVLDAAPPRWREVVVRDRHTGKLAEVSLVGEEEPIDPGDPGRTFAVQKGERFPPDAEIVVRKPAYFRPVPEAMLAERR